MKRKKTLLNLLLAFAIMSSVFLASAPAGHAQTEQDWTEPVNLSLSGASTDPLLVIDAGGTMHVIWVDQVDGYKYAKSNDGITWTKPQVVKYPFSPLYNSRPVLVANTINNSISVFWKDLDNTLYHKNVPSQKLNDPFEWSETLKVGYGVLDFATTVDSQGVLHLSYARTADKVSQDNLPTGIYYRRLSSAGWSTTRTLYISEYFRTLDLANSHVRISVTEDSSGAKVVYAAWDDRPQKRIFLAKSTDGGSNWGEPVQIKGPEDFTGSDSPFNIDLNAIGEKVLLLWQVGEPGSRCTQYSQWSTDGGGQFSDPIKVLAESVSCPKQISFIGSGEEGVSLALLNIQEDLALIAWDGSRWSTQQSQVELSGFLNPATFDNVLFSCQSSSVFKDSLYVVGCDKGVGGDIWFQSRSLGSFDTWFPPPSAWTSATEVATVRQKISSLVSVADNFNTVHTFWVQAPLFGVDTTDVSIQYVQWRNGTWSEPGIIFTGFDGIPVNLSSVADAHGRLLLLWNVGTNGDLYFSWASLDRARTASEWSVPIQVPTPTQISGPPDLLVDGSGRIVIAYSVPLNENRGIYIVQSDDLGKSWSQPSRVFDAVQAGWDLADQSKIGLSEDGRLHLLFSKSSLRESDRSGGLYYTQSSDGGDTWSQPAVISEKPVLWSDVVGFSGQAVHLFWQENNGISLDVYHQVSYDGGENWERPIRVFTGGNSNALVALGRSVDDQLFLVQTHIEATDMLVEVSNWDGSRWISRESKKVSVKKEGVQYSSAIGITPEGQLHVMISTIFPELLDGLQNDVISFSRSLDISNASLPPASFLIATAVDTTLTSQPEIQETPTAASPLSNLSDPPSSSRKNLVGLLIVGGVMVLLIIIIWPRGKRSID